MASLTAYRVARCLRGDGCGHRTCDLQQRVWRCDSHSDLPRALRHERDVAVRDRNNLLAVHIQVTTELRPGVLHNLQ